MELVAQLIDGTFPDYNLIVPKKKDTRVVARASEVLKACKAASVFARDSSNIVRFTVTPGSELEPGNVTVQATSAEAGDNVSKVDASVEGPAVQIAFNVTYVMDALSAAGTEQVAIELTTPASPGVFRPVGQEDAYQCVIMPMNLNR
jgi:DNA polymerase-3 subunit beta